MRRSRLCWLIVLALVLGMALPAWAGKRRRKKAGKAKRAAKGKRRRSKGKNVSSETGRRKKGAKTPLFRKRKKIQRGRIKAGVKDGSLTKREAGRLIRQQRRIGVARTRMASDGKLTPKERARLQLRQNRASRSIFKERHDAEGKMGPLPDPKKRDPGVNARQRKQRRRIAQGIRSGSLTKEEAKTLIAKERELGKLERELKSDGVLTAEERKQLHTQLNDLSKLIYGEKHDDERRTAEKGKIMQALKNGTLTRAQAKTVYAKMWRVSRLKRKLGGDEPVTDEERKTLSNQLGNLLDELGQ